MFDYSKYVYLSKIPYDYDTWLNNFNRCLNYLSKYINLLSDIPIHECIKSFYAFLDCNRDFIIRSTNDFSNKSICCPFEDSEVVFILKNE